MIKSGKSERTNAKHAINDAESECTEDVYEVGCQQRLAVKLDAHSSETGS